VSVAAADLSYQEAALARWRRGERHANAQADHSRWAAAWVWMTTPDHEQRAICEATHFHAGPCPSPRGDHYCHRGRCPARHHREEA
jgi:hypothetical protein